VFGLNAFGASSNTHNHLITHPVRWWAFPSVDGPPGVGAINVSVGEDDDAAGTCPDEEQIIKAQRGKQCKGVWMEKS